MVFASSVLKEGNLQNISYAFHEKFVKTAKLFSYVTFIIYGIGVSS